MTSTYSNADDGWTDERADEQAARSVPDLERPLVAVVERYASAPDECTIYPPADPENMTEWITAREGSFVALDEMR